MKAIATLSIVLGLLSSCAAQNAIVEYAKTRSSKSLSGSVNDKSGNVITDVRVREMSSDWKAQLRSTKTDTNGRWFLYPFVSGKTYCIEFSKPNFNTVHIRVKITNHGNETIVVELPVAT
jgi:Carboxypeptidase regulatory-like domain